DFACRRGADRNDAVALGDDGVARGERFIEIAGNDGADVDDSDTHGFSAGMRARPRGSYCFAPLTVASRLKLASNRSTRLPASPHPRSGSCGPRSRTAPRHKTSCHEM